MNLWILIRRALAFHWRMHLAVLLGVIVAGMVLTGALVIGDSMRGSLRGLVLERLGHIDQLIVSPQFFRQQLATEIAPSDAVAEPGILLQAALAHDVQLPANPDQPQQPAVRTMRTGNVQILGVQPRFFTFGQVTWHWRSELLKLSELAPLPASSTSNNQLVPQLPDDCVVINRTTANELGLTDLAWQRAIENQKPLELILRIPQPSDIPPDSALGRKTETTLSRRFKIAGVIEDTGLGRFALQPSQQIPRTGFVSLAALQSLLKQPDQANMIVLSGDVANPRDAAAVEQLNQRLRPQLADFGLQVQEVHDNVWQLTSNKLIIEPTVQQAMQAWAKQQKIELQPHMVYLANWIEASPTARVPYSTIAALDFPATAPLGPWVDTEGKQLPVLAEDEIVINQWVADDLAKQGHEPQVGETIRLTFFEPESTHGEVLERRANFTLRGIVPMSGVALDKQLTPEMKGITDKKSLTNWDPPFPYEPKRVRNTKPNDQDEVYWQDYKAMPKAFVSYATGQKLWSSRFGQITSLRWRATQKISATDLATQLANAMPREQLGMAWRPVKQQGLAAASGTTPFDGLFLGFSLYLIVAALLLVMLLFQLGLERRGRELGIELAQGLTRSQLQRQYLGEGFLVATVGAVLGAILGIGFAALMLYGLQTWWLAAIVTPFLQLHVTPRAVSLGIIVTVLVAMLALWWTLRKLNRVPVRQLLTGQSNQLSVANAGRNWRGWIGGICALGAITALITGLFLSGQSQAGAFFGAGFLLLVAMIMAVRSSFDRQAQHTAGVTRSLWSLAWSNAYRAPGRSVLTLGLMAVAIFLLVAISAFRLQPPPTGTDLNQGDGGFAFYAESDLPIFPDLASATDRSDKLNLDPETEELLASATVIPCRVKTGDDASCLNLFKPRQPRVIGVNSRWIDHGGFSWSAKGNFNAAEQANPWLALERELTTDAATQQPIYPVVLDQNTAMYSLQLYGGVGERFAIDDGQGGSIQLMVVGLLQNSIVQGDLLLSETNFRRLFPQISGNRFFLLAPNPKDDPAKFTAALEESLSDYGFLVESTRAKLLNLMAVQNTYLSTFQSLGGLGLLLGAVGVAVVQLRNAWERRGELALLQALGFDRAQLWRLVWSEGMILLLIGLSLGLLTAVLAIAPTWWQGAADFPWLMLSMTLAGVLLSGLIAGAWASRIAITDQVVQTLREEGN